MSSTASRTLESRNPSRTKQPTRSPTANRIAAGRNRPARDGAATLAGVGPILLDISQVIDDVAGARSQREDGKGQEPGDQCRPFVCQVSQAIQRPNEHEDALDPLMWAGELDQVPRQALWRNGIGLSVFPARAFLAFLMTGLRVIDSARLASTAK